MIALAALWMAMGIVAASDSKVKAPPATYILSFFVDMAAWAVIAFGIWRATV